MRYLRIDEMHSLYPTPIGSAQKDEKIVHIYRRMHLHCAHLIKNAQRNTKSVQIQEELSKEVRFPKLKTEFEEQLKEEERLNRQILENLEKISMEGKE